MSSEESAGIYDQRRDYGMNWPTLRFRDPEIEDTFGADNFNRQINITRLSIVMGGILFWPFRPARPLYHSRYNL